MTDKLLSKERLAEIERALHSADFTGLGAAPRDGFALLSHIRALQADHDAQAELLAAAETALAGARSFMADVGQQDTRDYPYFQDVCATLTRIRNEE